MRVYTFLGYIPTYLPASLPAIVLQREREREREKERKREKNVIMVGIKRMKCLFARMDTDQGRPPTLPREFKQASYVGSSILLL